MKAIFALLVVSALSIEVAYTQTPQVASVRTNVATLDRSRNRASVPLQLSHPPAEFHALLKEGGVLKPAPAAWTRTGGMTNLEIEPNKVYFLTHKTSEAPPAPGLSVTNRLLASSLVLMGRKPGGADAGHAEIISGTFFLRSVFEPVPWDSKLRAYQSTLKVGFDSTNSAAALNQFFPLAVQLLGSNITVEPDVVTVSNAGPAGYQTANVRCARYASQAAVIAHYSGADPATDQVCPLAIEKLGLLGMLSLMFPVSFLFATLAGGAAGGALRLRKLRRKQRSQWYWVIPEGILVGLVFVAAVSAGLGSATGSFSPAVVGSEPGAFAVAALSAFMGTSALDYLTKNLWKTQPPS